MDNKHFEFSSTIINLNNPLVTLEEKAFFLKKYISKHTVIHFDNKNNIVKLDIENKKATTLQEKLMNRVGDYLKTNAITLGTISLNNVDKSVALDELKSIIDRINIQFDLYVRSNHNIINRISKDLKSAKINFDSMYNENNKEDVANKCIINKNIIKDCTPELSHSVIYSGDKNKIKIPNINKLCEPHGYQLEFVNAARSRLLWCNSYNVGLGKTITSLITIQDQHNNDLKSKTIFTVPKSTLSNWYKEAFIGEYKNGKLDKPPVYDESVEEECLFIGLISPNRYKSNKCNDEFKNRLLSKGSMYDYLELPIDEQIALIKDKKYKKIFISHENFYRIRMKENSFNKYINYLKRVDSEFKQSEFSESNLYSNKINTFKDIIANESRAKNKLNIYLEDLGVDSIVIDEVHIFKNAKDVTFSNGSLSKIKYLSTPNSSARAIDMIAKTNYIRNNNINKDGILGLTATPLTNSPLELYSILSIIIGEHFINKLLSVNNISEFIKLSCIIDTDEDFSIDGELRHFELFKGINNLKMLREVMFRCIYFLNSNDESVKLDVHEPVQNEVINSIKMNKYQSKKIKEYKAAYNHAQANKNVKNYINSVDYNEYVKPVADKFHETLQIISSPFNFVRKMEKIILDEDLNENATIMFINNKYLSTLKKAIIKFNSKKIKSRVHRVSPHTDKSLILSTKYNEDEHGCVKFFETIVQAKIVDLNKETNNIYNDLMMYLFANSSNSAEINDKLSIDFDDDLMIVINTTKYVDQNTFFDILCNEFSKTKQFKSSDNIESDISNIIKFNISNKVKEILLNIGSENNNPIGKLKNGSNTDIVKQLIFCDQLGLHFKLKNLIHQLYEIPLNKIEIITGQYNFENEKIQEIQDGFNCELDENKYQIIIANEKAEVGINLQNGTQAIHHLTIGWTPDSKAQRDGRGIRQGNNTEYVNVYLYDMENTFDVYKRNLVNKKRKWIEQVIDRNGSDFVNIVSMLSKEQQERMIQLIGDEDEVEINLETYEKQIKLENAKKELKKVKNKQLIYLNFINSTVSNGNVEFNSDDYIKYCVQELMSVIANKNSYTYMINDYLKDKCDILSTSIKNCDDDITKDNKFILDKLLKGMRLNDFNSKKFERYGVNFILPNEFKFSYYNENGELLETQLFDIKIKRLVKSIILANNYLKDMIINKLQYINIDFSNIFDKFKMTIENEVLDKKKASIIFDALYAANDFYIINKNNKLNFDDKNFVKFKNVFFINYISSILTSSKDNYIVENMLLSSLYIGCNLSTTLLTFFDEIDNNILTNEIDDINDLNLNIHNMAVNGYKKLSETSESIYYPEDIIDDINNIYMINNLISYPENIILSVRDFDSEIDNTIICNRELKLKEIFEDLKNIICGRGINTLFYKSNLINNYLLKNHIHISLFGDKLSAHKQYPIDNKRGIITHKSKESNFFAINLPYAQYKSEININDNLNEKEITVKKFQNYFEKKLDENNFIHYEIFHNNENYSILMEVVALIEFFYLNKIDINSKAIVNATKDALTNEDSCIYYDYKNLECVKEHKYKFDYINKNVTEESYNKVKKIIYSD